jgi:hypothetical protein
MADDNGNATKKDLAELEARIDKKFERTATTKDLPTSKGGSTRNSIPSKSGCPSRCGTSKPQCCGRFSYGQGVAAQSQKLNGSEAATEIRLSALESRVLDLETRRRN